MTAHTRTHRFLATLSAIAAAFALLQGCSQQVVKSDDAAIKAETQQAANNDDYYEVEHEGRLYVFDDAETYKSFLATGETAYRKVRIGAGPNGETVVFGLTDADKKKQDGIAAIDMYDGRLAGGEPFYGEVHHEGRLYVFNRWQDLLDFKQVGEAPYRYTMIGVGPAGETVVIVLNKENKSEHPTKLIAAFMAIHGIK